MSRRRTPARTPATNPASARPAAGAAGADTYSSAQAAPHRPERVMVLTTEAGWGMRTRLLAMLGASLAERGVAVTFVCCRRSPTEQALAREFPSVPRRTVSSRSLLLRTFEVRRIARALRADAMLVQNTRDALVGSLSLPRGSTIVRRVPVGERAPHGWATRFAESRSRTVLLTGDGAPSRVGVAWPRRTGVDATGSPDRTAPSTLAVIAGRSPLARASGEVTAREHAAGALALRAASRLLSRHEELRVLLVGEPSALQPLRLHAGSLGLADRLSLVPMEALLSPGPFDAAFAWVTMEGDEGAVAATAAMGRRIPVVVPRGATIEGLVAPRISGFVADESELPSLVSALAHLIADGEEYRAMGTAAAARAERLHGWDAYVSRVQGMLASSAPQRASHTTPAAGAMRPVRP